MHQLQVKFMTQTYILHSFVCVICRHVIAVCNFVIIRISYVGSHCSEVDQFEFQHLILEITGSS